MDPALLFSSMFILFFFGFNADSFLGTEENGFTTQALIDRASKSVCGSTMLYGLTRFTSMIWDYYKNNQSIQIQDDTTNTSKLVDSSTEEKSGKTTEIGVHDDYHTVSPTSESFESSATPSRYMSHEAETLSAFSNSTAGRPFLGHTTTATIIERHHETLDAYLTKYDFGVFVFCLVLPALILWSMCNSNKRTRERTQIPRINQVGIHDRKATCCGLGCAADTTNDFCLTHHVPLYNRTQKVSTRPSIEQKLDEILAFARVRRNNDGAHQLPTEARPTELEPLKAILDTVISNSNTQAQELDLMRTEQQRIEQQMTDIRAAEAMANMGFNQFKFEVQTAWQQLAENIDTEPLKRRLEVLEHGAAQVTGWSQHFNEVEETLFSQIVEGKMMVQNQLLEQHQHIDALQSQVEAAQNQINSRFQHVEQMQKQKPTAPDVTDKLQDLDKRIDRLQQQTPIASNYDGQIEDLSAKVEQVKRLVLQGTEPADGPQKLYYKVEQMQKKLQDLDERFLQGQQGSAAADLEGKLQVLYEKLEQVRSLVPKTSDLTQKYQGLEERVAQMQEHAAITTDLVNKVQDCENRLGKVQTQNRREDNMAGKLQEIERKVSGYDKILNDNSRLTLKTHDEAISLMRAKIDDIENGQQTIDKKLSNDATLNSENFQQRLKKHKQEIVALKGKVLVIENEQQNVSERIQQISEQNSDMNILQKLSLFEKMVDERMTENTVEFKRDLEQKIVELDIDDLRIRLDLVEAARENHAEEFKNIQAHITAQEEKQIDRTILGLEMRLQEITTVIDSLHALHLQDKDGLQSTFSQNLELVATNIQSLRDIADDIRREVDTLRQRIYGEMLYSADPVTEVSEPIVKQIEELQKKLQIMLPAWEVVWGPLSQTGITGQENMDISGQTIVSAQPGQEPVDVDASNPTDIQFNQQYGFSDLSFDPERPMQPEQNLPFSNVQNSQSSGTDHLPAPAFTVPQSNFDDTFFRKQAGIKKPDWNEYSTENSTVPPQSQQDQQSLVLEDLIHTSMLEEPDQSANIKEDQTMGIGGSPLASNSKDTLGGGEPILTGEEKDQEQGANEDISDEQLIALLGDCVGEGSSLDKSKWAPRPED